ncbi:MAG: YmdB family metallophosphoesterase [Spirochaetia bacterium]
MRVIFLGEIIAKPGLLALKSLIPTLQSQYQPTFILAAGSALTRGFGLGKGHALQLRKMGIDILFGSDMILLKPDLIQDLPHLSFILRPANLPIKTTPGRGFAYYKNKENPQQILGVLCLQGQAGHTRTLPNNPFAYTHDLIEKLKQKTPHVVVCYHAQTTAEKQSMAEYLRGSCSAVIGYGTRVMTSDLKILRGTASITDVGFAGSTHSIGGMAIEQEIEKILCQRPIRSLEGPTDQVCVNGCIIDMDKDGNTTNVTTIRETINIATTA